MSKPSSSSAKQWSWIPIAAVGIFLCIYIYAASLYPGGTKFDPTRLGFSLIDNYWCDLLDEPTYGGHPNPARLVAFVGILILCTGLMVFWWKLPDYYSSAESWKSLVRTFGVLSGATIPLTATSYHDVAINVAMVFSVVAFGISIPALRKRGGLNLARYGAFTLGFSVLNFLIWQTKVGIEWLPLMQKIAFAAFLLWIVLVSHRVSKR